MLACVNCFMGCGVSGCEPLLIGNKVQPADPNPRGCRVSCVGTGCRVGAIFRLDSRGDCRTSWIVLFVFWLLACPVVVRWNPCRQTPSCRFSCGDSCCLSRRTMRVWPSFRHQETFCICPFMPRSCLAAEWVWLCCAPATGASPALRRFCAEFQLWVTIFSLLVWLFLRRCWGNWFSRLF